MTADEIVKWLREADVQDVAYVLGAAVQIIAMEQGMTEAELYHDFAERAAADPDANVVREKFFDGHQEVSNPDSSRE